MPRLEIILVLDLRVSLSFPIVALYTVAHQKTKKCEETKKQRHLMIIYPQKALLVSFLLGAAALLGEEDLRMGA